MRRVADTIAALLMIVLAGRVAAAQTVPAPAAESAPAPAPPKPTTNSHSRYWVVGGARIRRRARRMSRRAIAKVFRRTVARCWSMVASASTTELDFGLELAYGSSKLEDNDDEPILTTFVMGVVQVRPWDTRGFFFKTGMGAGVVGNLYIPNGPVLDGPITTNTLALVYGAGWVFKREQRFALQVHGTHHVAALGEVTTKDNTSHQERGGQLLERDGGNRVPIGACRAFYSASRRVRSIRPRYTSKPAFSAKTAALTAAAGHTTESSPPSHAFIVAVSSQSCRITRIRTNTSMP